MGLVVVATGLLYVLPAAGESFDISSLPPPATVTEKKAVPPSGDRRDYMTTAPYWWPDPKKADGLPYIRRDGEVNPQSLEDSDRERLMRMVGEVGLLTGLCVTNGDRVAGTEASRRLSIFFLDEKTGMRPNLEFAQGIPGRCKGRDIGIIETAYLVTGLLPKIQDLDRSGCLSKEVGEGLRRWFADYLDWLLTSKNGLDEANEGNNHSVAYDLQVVAFADFIGRRDVAERTLRAVVSRRVAAQIEPDGRMPKELARTMAYNYTLFNLGHFGDLALYGEKYGVELWSAETGDGRSIRKAFEWMRPYWDGTKAWEYAQIKPINGSFADHVRSIYRHFVRRERERALKEMLPGVFKRCAAHYKALDAAATPLIRNPSWKPEDTPHGAKPHGDLRIPHGWKAKTGELDMRSIYWWTAGHFPGSLWYLYEATGDDFFKERATAWTELLAPNSVVSDNHDVGFIMQCSYGNARRILKTDRYDALLKETASSLCKRYNPDLGLIRSWGAIGETRSFRVIPDNLMNLELLESAAAISGDVRFSRIARSHADVTMRHHFRPDGGCYHVLDYDQVTKRVKNFDRGQGASCETAWARGQSWAIYGYTMMYRFSKDRRYLDFAQKLSDFAISHPNMPADGVPLWDYGAPGEERDSSAAAIMASGLLELATFADGEKGEAYRAFAVRQLTTLCSDEYLSSGDENGHFLLKHGVGHKPAGSEIDTPLDYGDYYFLEALLRVLEPQKTRRIRI